MKAVSVSGPADCGGAKTVADARMPALNAPTFGSRRGAGMSPLARRFRPSKIVGPDVGMEAVVVRSTALAGSASAGVIVHRTVWAGLRASSSRSTTPVTATERIASFDPRICALGRR